jgi:hypothetical protein
MMMKSQAHWEANVGKKLDRVYPRCIVAFWLRLQF